MARKTYQGEKNNKSRTMAKLMEAVGIVLEKKGYTGLTITSVAAVASVDRKLVSVYFGTFTNLVESYIKEKDYWAIINDNARKYLTEEPKISAQHILENLLLDQLEEFSHNDEMQKIVLWQISENLALMDHITQCRERISNLFFSAASQELKDPNVDLTAISSLLSAGIYYLILHTKTTNSTFCEIDLTTEEGMGRIKSAVKKILENSYSK